MASKHGYTLYLVHFNICFIHKLLLFFTLTFFSISKHDQFFSLTAFYAKQSVFLNYFPILFYCLLVWETPKWSFDSTLLSFCHRSTLLKTLWLDLPLLLNLEWNMLVELPLKSQANFIPHWFLGGSSFRTHEIMQGTEKILSLALRHPNLFPNPNKPSCMSTSSLQLQPKDWPGQ